MVALSVLDLAPITEGSSAAVSLKRSGALAQHAEQWGYRRFWMAEHHNMTGIASAATAVALAHIGSQTSSIRIGAAWHYVAESRTACGSGTVWYISGAVWRSC